MNGMVAFFAYIYIYIFDDVEGELCADGLGEKVELATHQHAGCKVGHHGSGLEVKVTEHSVTSPSTRELYHVRINITVE